MPVISIAAAIIRDETGRFLLVRKSGRDLFMLPGGKIEPDETPVQSLVRELEEEIALDIPVTLPAFFQTMSAPAAFEDGATVTADLFEINFRDLTQASQPMASHEIEEVQWVAYPDTKVPLANLAHCVLDAIIARS